jgi:ABC-type nitrate/sulfonate/bicarbonate transport system substrate-binding protein
LVGKKIGVPALDGCNAGFPLEFAKQAGVENPSKALKFVVAPPEVLMDALKRGEIDVAGLHNMPDTTAKLYPEVDILFTDYDIFGNRGGDITYWFPKKFVEQNPDAIRHFVAALAKTNNWINENPEEAKRLYIEKINPNANAELLTLAHFGEDALIDDSHTQLWIDILSSGDSVQPLKRTWSVEELTTNRYNPNY